MSRFWSILFFLVPICGLSAFVMAALGVEPLAGAWLPENYSETGKAIDQLWYIVHWICALVFLLTGSLLGWVVWKFSGGESPVIYIQHNLTLEIVWTLIPAAILIALAFYQLKSWNQQRIDRPTITIDDQVLAKPPLVEIVARQFGWTFNYAGVDGIFDTVDDVSVENLMVVPDDEAIVLKLQSKDVIHSFFVPRLRLKHDMIPGMVQYAWFKPTAAVELDIVCAELCGWGHYKMNARLRIVSRAEFERWIKQQQDRIKAPVLNPAGAP